jgi:hypothetical protein
VEDLILKPGHALARAALSGKIFTTPGHAAFPLRIRIIKEGTSLFD